MEFVRESAGGFLLTLEHVPGDVVEFVGLRFDAANAVTNVGDGACGAQEGEDEAGAEEEGGFAGELLELEADFLVDLCEVFGAVENEVVDDSNDGVMAGEELVEAIPIERAGGVLIQRGANLLGEVASGFGEILPGDGLGCGTGFRGEAGDGAVRLVEGIERDLSFCDVDSAGETVEGEGEGIFFDLGFVEESGNEDLFAHEFFGAGADVATFANGDEASGTEQKHDQAEAGDEGNQNGPTCEVVAPGGPGGDGHGTVEGALVDETVAHGEADEFTDGVQIEFLHDATAVGFDGVDAEIEGGGDLLVGFAFGDHLEDFALAGGEEVDGIGDVFAVVFENDVADFGAEPPFADGDGADGGEEVLLAGVLEEVTAGTGAEDLTDVNAVLVHGQGEDADFWAGFEDAAGGFDAVEFGHGDVHDDDIGKKGLGEFEGFATV